MPSPEAAFFASQPPQRVDTGTARVAFRRYGSGDPLVLIHGWPFSGAIYRKLLRDLAQRYTCYAVDLPGAGATEWDAGNDFSFHGHAEHLKRFVEAERIERYHLVAHDTGATVARRLAIIDPERARKLVLIDTEIPYSRPPLVQLFQKVLALPGSAWAFRQLLRSRRFLRSSSGFGGCFVDRDLIEGEFHEHFIAPLVASPKAMEGQIRYARGIDWPQLDALREDHALIAGPVLLVWGDRDPFFPIDEARAMIPQFKDCRGLVEIPRAKLLPHEERPDVVLGHVRSFLEG